MRSYNFSSYTVGSLSNTDLALTLEFYHHSCKKAICHEYVWQQKGSDSYYPITQGKTLNRSAPLH